MNLYPEDSVESSASSTDSNSNEDSNASAETTAETTVVIDDNENQSGSNDGSEESGEGAALIGKDSSNHSFASEKGTSETLVGLICGAALLFCLLVSGAAIYCHRRGKRYGGVQLVEEIELNGVGLNETVCNHQIIECQDSESEEEEMDGLQESNTLIYGQC